MTKRTPKTRWIPENSQELRPSDAPEHVVYLYTTKQGKPAAIAYQGRKNKSILHNVYRDEAQRLDHINQQRGWWASDYKAHQEFKAKKNAPSELQAGDIVYVTWGWEQTNVDFYEILSLTPSGKSARIQHIKTHARESSPQAMAGDATPILGAYEDIPETRRTVGKFGVLTEFSKYGGPAEKWDGNPVGCSWYG